MHRVPDCKQELCDYCPQIAAKVPSPQKRRRINSVESLDDETASVASDSSEASVTNVTREPCQSRKRQLPVAGSGLKVGAGDRTIWVWSRRWACLVTWFCYRLIAKPGNKTGAPLWHDLYINGLVQDCSISRALAMEIQQSCTKPAISARHKE